MNAADYYMKKDGYEMWYTTLRRKGKKFRWFCDLEEAKRWLKRRKNSVIILEGSWQLFDLYSEILSSGDKRREAFN